MQAIVCGVIVAAVMMIQSTDFTGSGEQIVIQLYMRLSIIHGWYLEHHLLFWCIHRLICYEQKDLQLVLPAEQSLGAVVNILIGSIFISVPAWVQQGTMLYCYRKYMFEYLLYYIPADKE